MKLGPIQRSVFTTFTTSIKQKIIPKNLKGKSKSSQEWLLRQLNDPYVKKAQEMNYRARSAFKLLEIDEKLKILKPGLTIVECGASPGAWSQVIVQKINSDGKDAKKPIGKLIGIDLLPIAPLPGAMFLSGCDFTSPETLKKISNLLQNDSNSIDIVLSDMAPNASGHQATDHPRIMNLVKKVLQFAIEHGKIGSHFVTKIWDGYEIEQFEKELEMYYYKSGRLKPSSSRNDSSEIFLYGKGKKKINS